MTLPLDGQAPDRVRQKKSVIAKALIANGEKIAAFGRKPHSFASGAKPKFVDN
jgi:hypothetical protein